MSLCVLAGTKVATFAVSIFTLTWLHSVEKTEWQEDWKIINSKLKIVEARVKGSGAGMEPPENSKLVKGWYVYRHKVTAKDEILLATSETNIKNWSICYNGKCQELPKNENKPLKLYVCDSK
jgi:hypothetical protein